MTSRAVLLAHPAGHSLSPAMHDAAFAALGIDARYEAWDVPPDRLASAVDRLRRPDVLGANVTVPHKAAVMDRLDAVAPIAEAIGAVNVIRRDGARLVGENSDAEGFVRSLQESGVVLEGRRVALLGAGGAAHAVAYAAVQAGADALWIVNRTPERARRLAARLAQRLPERLPGRPADGHGRCDVRVAGRPEEAVAADVWVNATSVGMRRDGVDPDERPVPVSVLRTVGAHGSDGVAVDLVYRPRVTPFLEDAASAGLRTVDGTGMLLHQGAVAFEAWTGRPAPVAAMRNALEAALAAQARPAPKERR